MSNLASGYKLDTFRVHQLSNGFSVITQEDHSVPIVTCMIFYAAGSRYDPPGAAGMAHFLEHMLFKGTSRFGKGEIDYLTAVNGGVNNAFTSLDYAAYYFSFAADRWTVALEIEADRMKNNLFDPSEFELERQVILEELKMDLDTPWGLLRRTVETEAMRGHPYGHPVIGFAEDIEQITIQQMEEFYRSYYRPNNATLVLVGDFDTDRALSRVESLFGAIPSFDLPSVEGPVVEPEGKWVEVEQFTHVGRLIAAGPAPSFQDDDLFPLLLLEKVLTQGELSRLNERLVEREALVSFIDSELFETKEPYLLLFQAELNEGAAPERVRDAMVTEFERLCEDGVSPEELTRARNQCLHDFVADQEIGTDWAAQLGLAKMLDSLERLEEFPVRFLSVSSAGLIEVAGRYLQPEKFLFAVNRP
ncbi:MAG TPA: pitrilysin family protein [Acidobacteriota bacterium]|nr:pitrilysin family protein [Acidobacteriota bacterium]